METSWSKSSWRPSLSVKRRDLVKYLETNGFYLLRQGRKHSIYTNGPRTVHSRFYSPLAGED